MATPIYDINNFTIESSRYGYTVYYNGKFWESADTYSEAKKDIHDAVMRSKGVA